MTWIEFKRISCLNSKHRPPRVRLRSQPHIPTHWFIDCLCFVHSGVQHLVAASDQPSTNQPPSRRLASETTFQPTPSEQESSRLEELKELNQAFQTHQAVFLYGLSGMGKSTLAKLYTKYQSDRKVATVCLSQVSSFLPTTVRSWCPSAS